MSDLEIYIHIPFCVKKCAYCDFLSAASGPEEREAYVKLLCGEIEACPEEAGAYTVSSIFFGGGTPSLLEGGQIGRIMEALARRFCISEKAEITLEMNPGTVNGEKLKRYRQSGINRISIGLQSVHNKELNMLGRIHTYEEFLEAYAMARSAGFENVNIDLISAIPGQTPASWEETLRTAAALDPEHLSAYSLIIEPGTPFYEMYGEEGGAKREGLPDEEEERLIYRRTKEILEEFGYLRYEISNYAKPGYECRHNLGYWDRVPYLGFGIGAASLIPDKLRVKGKQAGKRMARYTNPDNVEEYQNCFQEKFLAPLLGREEEMEEFMFLGLRKMAGISKLEFFRSFHVRIEEIYKKQMEKLKKYGLLEESEGSIRLTEKGIDISNAVFLEFMF